jgi:hypothetical protein
MPFKSKNKCPGCNREKLTPAKCPHCKCDYDAVYQDPKTLGYKAPAPHKEECQVCHRLKEDPVACPDCKRPTDLSRLALDHLIRPHTIQKKAWLHIQHIRPKPYKNDHGPTCHYFLVPSADNAQLTCVSTELRDAFEVKPVRLQEGEGILAFIKLHD